MLMWVILFMLSARIHTYSYLPYITHLTAKPSRMIGVQVGVWCVSARPQQDQLPPTYTHSYPTYTLTYINTPIRNKLP